MKNTLKTVLLVLFVLLFLDISVLSGFCGSLTAEWDRPVLRFRNDGKFRIMMINDTQDTHKTVKDTISLIESALDKLKPDLVVLVGDNIAGYWLGVNEKKVAKAIDNIISPIDKRNIPFAVVFGNHDQESGVPKEQQMSLYRSYKNCLARDEGDALSNCGTYNLLIQDSRGERNIFNIWMIDSGTKSSKGGYESINADQIAWYERTSEALKNENGGKALPSLLFQHISVPEIYRLFLAVPEETEGALQGHRTQANHYYVLNTEIAKGNMLEAPCSPDKNSGEFAAWVRQGDILGAYFGHDHVNDFMGTVDGIDLGYSPGAGFYQYGPGVNRGVRIFELDENNLKDYQTKVLYFKDLVSETATTKIFDSYFVCELRIAIPVFLTAVILFLLLILLTLTLKKHLFKRPG